MKPPSFDFRACLPAVSPCSIPAGLLLLLLTTFFSCCKQGPKQHADSNHNPGKLNELAKSVSDDMEATERHAANLAEQVVAAYANFAERARSVDSANYRLESNGVLHRPAAVERDLPAVFVSGAIEVDNRIEMIVRGTESIDPSLKEVVDTSSIVVQSYYNDRNSYNRIYPPFDVLTQYPPGMAIPTYNFYYLADEHHNPGRQTTWIKTPYVDPAGRGWMISCLAPVYLDDKLEGVCGLDITVEALVRDLDLEASNNLFILVSNEGTVVAAGEIMSRILRLPNLKSHRYVDTVRSDTLRTDDYNLRKSSSPAIRKMIHGITVDRVAETMLEVDGRGWHVRAAGIDRLDWHVLEFTPLS